MEVDTGAALSIIWEKTRKVVFPEVPAVKTRKVVFPKVPGVKIGAENILH